MSKIIPPRPKSCEIEHLSPATKTESTRFDNLPCNEAIEASTWDINRLIPLGNKRICFCQD
jgi:hypothetical protein